MKLFSNFQTFLMIKPHLDFFEKKFLLSDNDVIPGFTTSNTNKQKFWYSPWLQSTLRLFKQTFFFWKTDTANGFFRYITTKNDCQSKHTNAEHHFLDYFCKSLVTLGHTTVAKMGNNNSTGKNSSLMLLREASITNFFSRFKNFQKWFWMQPTIFHMNSRFKPNFSHCFNRSLYSIICCGISIFENVKKVMHDIIIAW